MYKSKVVFYGAGIAIGAGIGFAVNNLAIGMGLWVQPWGLYLPEIIEKGFKNKNRKGAPVWRPCLLL